MYLKGNCVLKLFAVVRIKLGAVEDSEGEASKEVPGSENDKDVERDSCQQSMRLLQMIQMLRETLLQRY